MENNVKVKYKNNQNIITKIWLYMRRNRTFRVGDFYIIFNISYPTLKLYLKVLEDAEYIKFCGKSRKPFTEIQYQLIKNTGVFAPKLSGNILYDPNLKISIKTKLNRKEKIVYPKTLMNILNAIDTPMLSFDDICKKANCANGGLRKWWNRLINFGIVKDYVPKVKKGEKWIYEFNLENVNRVKEELLKGGYTRTNPELKHLWIQQESTNS